MAHHDLPVLQNSLFRSPRVPSGPAWGLPLGVGTGIVDQAIEEVINR